MKPKVEPQINIHSLSGSLITTIKVCYFIIWNLFSLDHAKPPTLLTSERESGTLSWLSWPQISPDVAHVNPLIAL